MADFEKLLGVGTRIYNGKIKETKDKDGKVIAVYKSCSEAARKNGINRTGIGKCARGNTKLKTYKGYEWKYKFE